MPEAGLVVDLELPFAWLPDPPAPSALDDATALLRVINLPSLPSGDSDPTDSERIEVKLDLMLCWLARSLQAASPVLVPTRLDLQVDGVRWRPAAPVTAARGSIVLAPSPALPAPITLPARFEPGDAGTVRAIFDAPGETLAELWTRWLFRLHRRAIQTARRG